MPGVKSVCCVEGVESCLILKERGLGFIRKASARFVKMSRRRKGKKFKRLVSFLKIDKKAKLAFNEYLNHTDAAQTL